MKLKEFSLPISMEKFLSMFWFDDNTLYYEKFLIDKLEDLSVNIADWESMDDSSTSKSRKIHSYHPSKVSFPGLPSHAESFKTQIFNISENNIETIASIKETNSFNGIPYADYFTVDTEWIIKCKNSNNNNNNVQECYITITLDVIFQKSTWLQGTIESNTKAELLGVYELWLKTAEQYIKDSNKNTLSSVSQDDIDIKNDTNDNYLQEENDSLIQKENINSQSYHVNRFSKINTSSRLIRNLSESSLKSSKSDDTHQYSYYDTSENEDEELFFYDCEEGGLNNKQQKRMTSMSSFSQLTNSTSQELHYIYSKQKLNNVNDNDITAGRSSSHNQAVKIVETIFVLIGYAHWQIHRFYSHELRFLFNIEPIDVILRIKNAFIAGKHESILLNPDMYGPLLAVLLLPQSLLISMDVSLHGCNRSSILGNAIVVSFCLWLGLSSLYRLLSYLFAPAIKLKHCLCMTGYSFFYWNLAILLSYPLELNKENLNVPISWSLMFFGLPSSIALSYMFWEHTPSSSLTLQPTYLHASLQQFATNHRGILQKLLWQMPKIFAFLIVSGTHYQFLWYVSKIFIPGRKQLCELTAMMTPANYKDILAQKELRNYASLLLNVGKNS